MLNPIDLIFPLIVGVLLGYFLRSKKRPNLNGVTFWAIMILIFSLGFSIGSNNELLNSLPIVGLNAIIISLLVILFSVFFVEAARKMVKIE